MLESREKGAELVRCYTIQQPTGNSLSRKHSTSIPSNDRKLIKLPTAPIFISISTSIIHFSVIFLFNELDYLTKQSININYY